MTEIKYKGIYCAENNRYSCTSCKERINKGDKFYRKAGHHSVTNLCRDCVALLAAGLELTPQDIQQALKKAMLSRLEEKKWKEVIRGEKN